MFSFSLFSIPVRVEPWFWITMVLIGGGLRADSSQAILNVAMFVLAGFISILVHEFGHAWMIRKFRLPAEITLHGFGGYATYPAGRLNRKQSFVVTAAGPGIQMLMAILLLILYRVIPVPPESLLNVLVSNLIAVSFVWSILNCLPVYPLDGGQMMASVLGPRRERTMHLISLFVAVFIGILAFVRTGSLLLVIFMGLFAFQNWQAYEQKR